MSSTESPISITVKSTGGALVTVRAANGEELDALVATSLDALVSAVTELEQAVRPTPVNTGQPVHPNAAYAAGALGGQPVADFSTASRMCPHGPMTRIAAATGKFGAYKGYFCPAQQGDSTKCATQYIKQNMPEWNTFVADVNK